MKELFRLLSGKERRTLVVLAAASGLALLSLVFVAAVEMRNYRRADASARTLAADLVKAEAARDEAGAEARRWEVAGRDLEKLRTERFYDETREIRALRLDLQRIFAEAGIQVSKIGYQYSDMEKGKMKKVVAGFTFGGTYGGLKRFLSVIERSPKFLTIERIDFPNTGQETGALQLKIELAAYYAM
jgi:hypothetical protein